MAWEVGSTTTVARQRGGAGKRGGGGGKHKRIQWSRRLWGVIGDENEPITDKVGDREN